MANIKIIDLPTGSPESTSFVEATQVDELAESGRSTVKLALNALGNFVAGQGASPLEYGNLETESTTLIGAANELHNTIGADAYDDTATYNTGDYCIYGGELYKCNDDNVTGAWNATKWDLTKVVDELGGGGGNADFIECTQAEYDAWEQAGTLDPDVMYFITDGQAGGSSTLAGLSDVNLTNPTDGQLLRYNGTSGKWENVGIINDTTASASSVYSSNKVNSELALKQNSTDNSLDTTNKTIVGAINEHELDISNMNIASVTRVAATVTTGSTGNIALPYDNDGYTYIVGAMCTTSTYVPVVWVSSSTNGWFITIRGAETWSAAANQQVNIRYLVVRIKSM